jgi:ankyrin repeat protein
MEIKIDFLSSGWSPLHYAAWLGGDVDKVKELIEGGADVNEKAKMATLLFI